MIQLEHPGWLLLLVLLIPVLWWSRHARHTLGSIRGVLIPTLRCLLILTLVLALADPIWSRSSNDLTVAVVLDRSSSVDEELVESAVHWLQDATRDRGEGDLLALVHAGQSPEAVMMPDRHAPLPWKPMHQLRDATDLASAVEFAKGLLPEEGMHRLLLVSDGLETTGSLLAAADSAATIGLPIDVLPLVYSRDQEVQVERLVVPQRVLPGADVPVQVVLRSEGQRTGRLRFLRDGSPVGTDMLLNLEPGVRVLTVTLPASDLGVTQFEAVFEPEGAGQDRADNNRAAAITLAGQRGGVLVVSEGDGGQSLVQFLRGSGLRITEAGPEMLTGGPASLAAWDAIVMVNIPRWSLPESADGELKAWIHQAGGGLVMTGGPNALGAGGWIGSELANALPVDLDPPSERVIRRGALALILHSCEMPRGNYWGRRVAEAAIETLSQQDWVGILEYDNYRGRPHWALPMQVAGDKEAALQATASLRYGDMPSFQEAMQDAHAGLVALDAGQRHIIIISDGDPTPPTESMLQSCRDSGITVTTVMVGGHGTPIDRRRMRMIAEFTGGRFYDVTSPDVLPTIFMQESQVVSRTLIQRGVAHPVWTNAAGGPFSGALVESLGPLPPIEGYVLTGPGSGMAADRVVVPRSDERADPLLAWWIHGDGRVVVCSSDPGRWMQSWQDWEGASVFWSSIVNWVMRSQANDAYELILREEEDGRVLIELDVSEVGGNFLQVNAAVIGPGGGGGSIPMRQTGVGRYTGQFTMNQPGGWVVAAHVRGTTDQGAVDDWVHGALVRSWPAEAAAVRSQPEILQEVASRTGGRVLSMGAPAAQSAIFDRSVGSRASSQRGMWSILAVCAALILLVDIAVRRIVPDQSDRPVDRPDTPLASGEVPSSSAPPVMEDHAPPAAPQVDDTLSRLQESKRRRQEDSS